MSTIKITPDNLSKFTKRLHKALSEHHASNPAAPTLSQSSEIFAKALGAVNLHELQTLLGVVPLSFEEQWVTNTEQTILNYLQSTPQSKLTADGLEWFCFSGDGNTYLNLYNHKEKGKDAGEGVFFDFKEHASMHSAQQHMEKIRSALTEHFSLPQCDIDFIGQIAEMFPTDPLTNIQVVQFLKTHRGVSATTPYKISPPLPKQKSTM